MAIKTPVLFEPHSPTVPLLNQGVTPLCRPPSVPAAATPSPVAAFAANVAGPGHVAASVINAVLLCTSLTACVRNAPTTLSSTLPPQTTLQRRLPNTRLE